MLLQKKHRESGFTLIELSIGIVVIGVLVGLALIGIGDSKNDAQSKKRNAVITAIETAKNRYILDSDETIIGEETLVEHIAPLMNINGEQVESIFDLVKGTGKQESDLDLGSYQVRPANFGESSGGNTVSNPTGGSYTGFDDFLTQNGGYPEMNPSEYSPIIDNALEQELITEDILKEWGYDDYLGTWLPQTDADKNHANDAEVILGGGGSWESLNNNQKEGLTRTLEAYFNPETWFAPNGTAGQGASWEEFTAEEKQRIITEAGKNHAVTTLSPALIENMGFRLSGYDGNYLGYEGLWYQSPNNTTAVFVGWKDGKTALELFSGVETPTGTGWYSIYWEGDQGSSLNLTTSTWGMDGPSPSGVLPDALTNTNIVEVLTEVINNP